MAVIRTSRRMYMTLIAICISLVSGQMSAHNRTYSLEKRGGFNVMGALGGGGGGSSQSLKDPCGYIDLTPENWQALGIDDYLAHYPNGDKLTLQEFAAELNMPNFYCGVGMQCLAGQLCSPAVGINWIILYAIQQWSNFMNSLYKAVEHAVTMVKDASSSIVSDFTSIIPPNDQLFGWTVADVVCGVLGSISALAVPMFIPADSIEVAMADLAVASAFQATPEMGIGRDENSPREGQDVYNAARAALKARDLSAFDKLQTSKDDQTFMRAFQPGQKPQSLLLEGSSSPRPHPIDIPDSHLGMPGSPGGSGKGPSSLVNSPPQSPSSDHSSHSPKSPFSREPIITEVEDHPPSPHAPLDHPSQSLQSPSSHEPISTGVEDHPPSPQPPLDHPSQSPQSPSSHEPISTGVEDHPSSPHSPTLPGSPKGDDHKLQRRSIIKHKEGHSSNYAYTRYAYLESRLSSIQNRIQSYIAVNFKMATMAPILAKGGLAEILQGGAYLNPNPNENELQEGGKALAQITALAQLFQSLKVFVTIGAAECNAGGPNGAWNKKDELSYCSPDGLMMNIVQAAQSGLVIAMPNAHLLEEKYGYTTEYLARSAWECQKKYGIYTNSSAPPPVNMRSDCLFPIAVCDCTTPSISKMYKGKNKKLVEACRTAGNLPI
ncbi:hypothetical protein PSTG_15499 [Puccinia striiformis f. sp. tritici PST-78]|uniref:DUF7872 domain-containing protein n=1 Tax=Puccinia striiformis f. sp. tritici PST-78 TaxID=1165861 RepID=A0A0L0UVL1_9BASI|nr:hypothetical protein PSTG_15499 [Puccinia striiformis f. sp. tritici PST-78]